jgi:hypothetical protein
MYVKPPLHIKTKHWSSLAEVITGLTHHSYRSRMLNQLLKYGPSLCTGENIAPSSKTGCIAAWNGESSDMKWLWVVSEEKHPTCKMPAWLEYFMDPMSVIKRSTAVANCI